MLSRRLVTCVSGRSAALKKPSRISTSIRALATYSDLPEEEAPKKAERKLQPLKEIPEPVPSLLGDLFRPVKPKEKVTPFVLPAVQFAKVTANFGGWIQTKRKQMLKDGQAFRLDRHKTLGCDLAAAHFLIHRGGKVKFHHEEDWIEKKENTVPNLPHTFDKDWRLSHIDAHDVQLYYEGIENFVNLNTVVWARFSNNRYFDDWCMDRIAANLPNVEYLDISSCENVTERGLEAFYKLYKLKTLVITDWDKTPSFELTCAMLEDCCPGLTVEFKDGIKLSDKEYDKKESAKYLKFM